jgi:hypothetical protein
MLQIHDFIQNMPYEPNFFLMKDALTRFAESGDGASFDFGDMQSIEDEVFENLSRYGHELAKNKILKLPYNPVYYSWSYGNKLFGVYITQEEHLHEYDSFKAVFMTGEKKPFRYVGIGTLEINEFGRDPPTDIYPDLPGDFVPINLSGKIIHFAKGVRFADDGSESALYQSVCYYIVTLTALMESPHTKTRVTAVGAKLNLNAKSAGYRRSCRFIPFILRLTEKNTTRTAAE